MSPPVQEAHGPAQDRHYDCLCERQRELMATLEDLEARVAALEAAHADYRAVLAAVNALGANQEQGVDFAHDIRRRVQLYFTLVNFLLVAAAVGLFFWHLNWSRPLAVEPITACSEEAMPRRSGCRSSTSSVTTGTISAQP